MKNAKVKSTMGILILIMVMSSMPIPSASQSQREIIPSRSFPEGCTVFLVGKQASTDGSVMTTQTADCGKCDWTWRHIPAADHEPGSVRKIYHIEQMRTWPLEIGQKWDVVLKEGYTGFDIPQVAHTYAYFHSAFGYMNERQLALAESSIGCRPKMDNPTPAPMFDITMLTLLVMERCETAREAIKLMGELAEKYGYGYLDSGEMLALADPNEVWAFEIMPVGPLWTPKSGKPGAVWCAQRVPDDHVSVCPNESRIGETDLEDPDNFMASPNVISYAVEQGFYDPESGKPFNWQRAYSPTEESAESSQARYGRVWRFFDLVAPSQKFSLETPNMDFPFSVKPDKKLSLKDLIALTRDKYQGTPFDPAKGLKGGPFSNPNYYTGFTLEGSNFNGPRCINVNKAEYTSITVCRDWLPDPIGGMVWLSFGAQDTSCYMPIYAGITEIPVAFNIGDHWHFDRSSARWAFDYVDFHTQVVYSLAIQDVQAAQLDWEDAAIDNSPAIENTALELYEQDPSLSLEFLTEYCNINAQKVIDAWWELGDKLLVKYNHFRVYETKDRTVEIIKLPEWWNKAAVEYDKLRPVEKKEKESP